jgi:hypothetical protein
MLRTRGGDGHRGLQPERQYILRIHRRIVSAGDKDTDRRSGSAGDGAHTRSEATIGNRADRGAHAGCSRYRARVAPNRSIGLAFSKLGLYRYLLAIDEANFGQFNPEARGSFHTAAFLRLDHATGDHLPPTRNHQAVSHQRLHQSGCKGIAGLIVVGGNRLIHTNGDPGTGRQSDPRRNGRRGLLVWVRCLLL